MLKYLIPFLTLLVPVVSEAAPYKPVDASEVLETLYQPEGLRQIRALQKQHEQDPANRELSLTLIDDYIALGRREADPRYFGYAEAILKPMLPQTKAAPDPELLIREANILQHRHDFDAARVILNKIIKLAPTDPQAHIMRAVIALARGDYPQAQADCHVVFTQMRGALLGLTCVQAAESFTGNLQAHYDTLRNAYPAFAEGSPQADRGWALSALGEMAQRMGDSKAAESYFKQALRNDEKDYYAMAALSDLWLDENRPGEVVSLLTPYTRQDNLLLRLALAEDMAHGENRDTYTAMLKSRILAANERKEIVHLRDYARYALQLDHDPEGAFRMAKENWKTQKEPADAKILIESAIAAGEKDIARDVLAWQKEQGIQDATFDKYKNL